MENVIIQFVYDRKNETGHKKKIKGRIYKDFGILHIEVRIEKTSKRVIVNTNIKLRPDQVSFKNGFTCKNHDNAKAITGKAINRFREVEAFVLSDKCKTIDQVKYWDKEDFTEMTVEKFIMDEMARKDASIDTIRHNRALLTRLKEFGKIGYFSDITYSLILEFDSHLRKTIGSEEALKKRHALLKGYIQEAINRGLINMTNPYTLFIMPKVKTKDPVFLTETEVEQIKATTPNFGYLERTRDLFLFQCFTGLAYIDLMKFSKESVYLLDDYKIIKSNRTKTDENFITLFLPEAERIADKYNYELPKITNQKYNEYLKEVAKLAGIDKQLVSHSARHTFATYLLNKDVPIETVSRALGHASIKQTQHYARLSEKKVIDDMKKLL